MSALHTTRRALLRAGTASTGVLIAGCAGGSNADGSDRADPTERVTDPETVSIRGSTDAPIVRKTGPDTDRDADGIFVLREAADADALAYDRDSDGADDVDDLLAETEFDDESVIVYQDHVDGCYERRLEYVESGTATVELQFCRVERDAVVTCERDRKQVQATFVRAPFADDSEPTRRSVGVRSSCGTSLETDGNGTVAGGE
ncbi:hypothetical protein [Natrinema salifodinae]|uniref:Uncharacterized protein n=1 Tax=Natrinema salifodinae TaxID=1202768 RepID=A0A1I0PCX3_9EURY|nr:hypothetical protein [Natrinema salifodinae]SEW12209.1 hypothetical protein SAMN05216285_2432 [Natrinema salifodinae]